MTIFCLLPSLVKSDQGLENRDFLIIYILIGVYLNYESTQWIIEKKLLETESTWLMKSKLFSRSKQINMSNSWSGQL